MFRLLSASLSLCGCLLAQSSPNWLEGCPDPIKLAPVLSKLQQQKWVGLGPQDLADLWPVELEDTNSCEPHCQLLESEDRIIQGRVDCGASFRFDTSPSPDSSSRIRLESFTLDYKARTARDLNAADLELDRSCGVPDTG